VNAVWILQEVTPYEGNEILGVFVDPQVAMGTREGRWFQVTIDGDTFWRTGNIGGFDPFYLLTEHPLRSK